MSDDLDTIAPAPENIAELADACVRFVERATGLTLDYTPETLPFLDHWVSGMKEKPVHEILSLVAPTAGAYFGEVVRRAQAHVRWRANGDDFQRWRLEYETCFLHFNPIGVAVEAITLREADGWSSHFQMLDEDADAVSESLAATGSVRADDCNHLAGEDFQRDPFEHLDWSVSRPNIRKLKKWRSHSSSTPRYAAMTFGFCRTSSGVPSAIFLP